MANRVNYAPSHGGGFRSGQPSLLVVHSLEAPARRGLAWDLAAGWLKTAGVSPHTITDPGETVETCPENIVGWHCGNGNQYGIGFEVTGYAAWSLEQWTTGDAWAALRLDAKRLAESSTRLKIPLRWLSLNQIRNGERGVCTHADITLTYGGTTHTDPGRGFPFDAFMRTAVQWQGGTGGGGNPDPQPGGGAGGAEGETELSAAEVQQLKTIIEYGFDKIMDGKNGEAPDHNIRQVKEAIAALDQRLSRIEANTLDTHSRVRGGDSGPGERHETYDMLQDILSKVDSPKA